MIISNGYFYNTLTSDRGDSDELKQCIENTVDKLTSLETNSLKPGILLGKIQSGKTRAFLGAIALAFDNNYDVTIVLTKGTKALAEQTYQRILNDFRRFLDNDEVQVYDIMHFPQNLTSWELKQKLIIIAKKEINNLKRVIKALGDTYPNLKDKRVLIVDDEADFASVSYKKDKETGLIEPGKISGTIDSLRGMVAVSNFLQVTATPYSLYLQPDVENQDSMLFKPKRPCFTVLVPIHKDYVGGDFYFLDSQNDKSSAYYIFEKVPIEELRILKKEDKRRFKTEEVLRSDAIMILRTAIVNFLVGGAIRQLQQDEKKEKQQKYSFVVHTEQSRASHNWQVNIVTKMIDELIKEANNDSELLEILITKPYEDLKKSLLISGVEIPESQRVKDFVKSALKEGYVMITRVNSDNEVEQLLDNTGQLKLRTPFNIFIGGQILDRGITIKGLIGFYYGRNPQRFQQDTVLQHSRMYGARSKEDLAVTRFYTTQQIYEMMQKINEFDEALREAFLKGAQQNGVYFIRKDPLNRIIACSPNKILLSKITTLRPYKRLLPVGFQTGSKTTIKKAIKELDCLISNIEKSIPRENGGYKIELNLAEELIRKTIKVMVFEKEYAWDLTGVLSALELISKITNNRELQNKIWLVIRKGNNLSRTKDEGRKYSDDPDGGVGAARDSAKILAKEIPAVMMIQQNGLEEKGWKGIPFWWPVILMPKNTPISIFASETVEEE